VKALSSGGEIHDPARAVEFMHLGNKHLAGLHLLGFTGIGVQTHVFGKALLEHQRDALTHHPYGIDRVHQRFGAGFKKVALCKRNHQKYHPGMARISNVIPLVRN
jgi:hypothetical protein